MATPPTFTAGSVLTAAQMNAVGLWKITPTSVSGTGASISNGDVVVASGGSNFTVNGAFTSDFSNYKIIIRDYKCTSASAVYCALGTSNTGTSHKFAGVYVGTGLTVSALASSGTTRFELPCVGRGTTTSTGCEFTLIGPNIAQETTFTSIGIDSDNGALYRSYSGIHTADTAYSSLYFSTDTTQTFTSIVVSIYGFR
jgi:hypothetical protein